MKTAIVVSAGRTGTRFLARYLDANFPGVVARHEPRPRYRLRVLSNAYRAGRVSREAMAAALVRARRRAMARLRAELYVECNPYLHGFVDVLEAVWTDPLLVHVVRDPRSYVRSVLNHGNARGVKRLANALLPYWIPDVRRSLELAAPPSAVGLFAGQWRIVNEALAECGRRRPRYRLIHFEDLFDDYFSGLRRLCATLDLEFRDEHAALPLTQRINPSRDDAIGDWRQWPESACAELHRICSPLMQHLGYGAEPEWLKRVGVEPPEPESSA